MKLLTKTIAGFAAAFMLVLPLAAQQAPDRSKAPAPGPAPALKLPPIQKRALANGLGLDDAGRVALIAALPRRG